jgi:hypothetical protein
MRKPSFCVGVLTWLTAACKGLRRSQQKTLAELVGGAMNCRRVSLADIGRAMGGKTLCKSRINRMDRFLGNEVVEVVEGMRGLVWLSAKATGWQLLVAVDWVDIRGYKVLRAAVPLRGRSVPIMFAAYYPRKLFKSQNALEEGFLTLLKSLLPEKCQAVVIADRGFARAELARKLGELGLDHIIRVGSKVRFESTVYTGLLKDLELLPGEHLDLKTGCYREEAPVKRRVLAYWGRGHEESWLLGTNLDWGWRRLTAAFERRMMIEELFRDEKNLRYGWGLRQLSISNPERLERLFLILAFAYILLLMTGLICKATMSSAEWSSNTRSKRPLSAFVVGRIMLTLGKVSFSVPLLLSTLRSALAETALGN